MKEISDLDINRGIRRILVKHWVDLGRISVRTTQGRIRIHGFLQRIPGRNEALTIPIVERIFYDISRVNGVRKVYTTLENWIAEGGRWRPVEPQHTQKEHTTARNLIGN